MMLLDHGVPKLVNEWKEWMSQGDLVAVFQPILSSESTSVYGYEVLGRLLTDRGLISLGQFFLAGDDQKGQHFYANKTDEFFEYRKEIDRKIRSLALQQFVSEAPPETKLFINISPSVIFDALGKIGDEIPFTIRKVRELGIDASRIVIEITEERFPHNLELLKPIINMYRNEGFSIAVDDAGSEASNLDRIGLFHPEIIKVDLQMLRRSTFSRNFKEILLNLSRLGESLGSSLLFEGIETKDELYNALNYGARYIQGYYFTKASEEFTKRFSFRTEMQKALEYFHDRKKEDMDKEILWETHWKEKLSNIAIGFESTDGIWEWNGSLDSTITTDDDFYRMYITTPFGFQVSPNYTKSERREMNVDYSFLGKNWSFRPYFFEHIHKSKTSKDDWTLSPVYHDISEKLMLRTFARNISENLILFIDVVVSR
ncbi:EAL domain-containing protein [Leptospira sp. 96542]|nr:EAL domain-containing protein [Leptospira sp. 96542]